MMKGAVSRDIGFLPVLRAKRIAGRTLTVMRRVFPLGPEPEGQFYWNGTLIRDVTELRSCVVGLLRLRAMTVALISNLPSAGHV